MSKSIKEFLFSPFKKKRGSNKKSEDGLDSNGRLKKGWKYENGKPVKVK